MGHPSTLLVLLLSLVTWQVVRADLVRVDLSTLKAWRLTNSNQSINLPATVPTHTLSVLASAGVIPDDPLYRYGERDTRWVGEERWNFTLLWSGKKHQLLEGCRHVLLVMHGIDTFATVVLNGQHVLQADNAHRSWWVPLSGPAVLRDGANMLSVVLQPAAAAAARAKLAYPYLVPTMQVPRGAGYYNFVRKPAFDFGWDWGPAFVPVGITGKVELVGFDRATLIGSLVSQQFNSSANTFDLTVTAQFVVPAAGDNGTLSVTLAALELRQRQQVELKPGRVGGNQLQALVTTQLQVPAARIQLWQPLTLLPKGKPRELYDLTVMFEPTTQPTSGAGSICGVLHPDSSKEHFIFSDDEQASSSSRSSSGSSDSRAVGSNGGGSRRASSGGCEHLGKAPVPEIRSTFVQRVGFRTLELVMNPIQTAARELLTEPDVATQQQQQQQQQPGKHGQQYGNQSQQQRSTAASSSGVKQDEQTQIGESFYFKVNGKPLFAKGANLIPLHVLSTAVSAGGVRALLQSAVDANMNMIRIWGGGIYQIDELYDAADELGLMVWQEAMFACSPYPRNAGFLANVQAELTQQFMRLGSHASLVVFGGNNEVEQSLEWYEETRDNLAMYAADYSALFEATVGTLAQKMMPGTPWVDSSPGRGRVWLPDTPRLQETLPDTATSVSQATAAPGLGAHPAADDSSTPQHADGTGAGAELHRQLSEQREALSASAHMQTGQTAAAAAAARDGEAVKRWGNTNDPRFGDVHFYNYKDDCQDWRTYPHARFISEYGWQSYPSWSTYAAATAEEDWQVKADMTEYRQRHPNGTAELLAQLQRRFRLPQAWLDLLPHQQQEDQQRAEDPLQPALALERQQEQAAAPASVLHAAATRQWDMGYQLAAAVLGSVRSWLALDLPSHGTQTTDSADQVATSGKVQIAAAAAGQKARSLTSGGWQDTDSPSSPAERISQRGSSSAGSSGGSENELRDMQHFVYLTQLQQMLCYETALYTWRALRSDPATLSMGVLYWQLNDVWAGASWSSVDYGSVWKPVQYGVARAFADVTLSVQHDLQDEIISVFGVNDLQQPVSVELAVRLLSITDTPAVCQRPRTAARTSSSKHSSSISPASHAAPYVKVHTVVKADVAPGAAVLLWSKSVASLLTKASKECSRSNCYMHIALACEGHAHQEATVWLAPFKELPFQDPVITVNGFEHSKDLESADVLLTGSGNQQEAVNFTVSSQAVAAFAVWETQGIGLPGHFSDNAVTVHPCEPRRVTFLPRAGGSRVHVPLVASGAGGLGGGDRRAQDVGVFQGQELLQLLQEQLVVTSLWDHQQLDQRQPQQKSVMRRQDGGVHERLVAE